MNLSVISKLRPSCRNASNYNHDMYQVLSSENLLRTISKFQALPLIRMQTQEPRRKAAVLIPLCVVDSKVSLLYTLRTSSLRSHKGQVSFPGGMQDAKDKSLQATALRETKEELGIDECHVKVWGMGNAIIPRQDPSVTPVIATLSKDINIDSLKINPSEVEQVFTVPIDELCQRTAFTQYRAGYSTPVYFAGPRRIWGLTAIITNAFLQCLVPHGTYAPKIRYIQSIKTNAKRVNN